MTNFPGASTTPPPIVDSPTTKLEPNALSAVQDAFIGAALVGPAVSVAFTLALLAADTAYGAPLTLILTAIPIVVIANAYRRLNLWNANCGASFEWVGRAINPYLGFLTGWLMITGTLIGTLTPVVAIGPNIMAVFNGPTGNKWDNVALGTAVALVMLIISVIGIRLTARTQVTIGVIEYAILIFISVSGLVFVLSHHAGTFPITKSWFTLNGINGKGSLAAGFLVAVFMYSGWDGTLYVNEEVRHRRENPGKAAIGAVLISMFLFVLAQVGLQGVASPANLQKNSASGLVYVATVVNGSSAGKAAAIALALSVIAATGAGILLTARIIYGMASHNVLPGFLANVSPRFSTPAIATIISGAVLIILTWFYLLSTSIQSAFSYVINITGLLYGSFYALTALAAIVYYRRRIVSNVADFITVGILPLGAIGFLVWVIYKTVTAANAAQNWTLGGTVIVGVILMIAVRLFLRPAFFRTPRESYTPGASRAGQ
jgi:amino acid transporter